MCSCTPNTSWMTITVGRSRPPAGFARYAGIWPSTTGMRTSPASRPAVSVVIVSAPTGSTAAAKPDPSAVTTKPRRVNGTFGKWLATSCSSRLMTSP